jgi:excisionase family DNA binding protein
MTHISVGDWLTLTESAKLIGITKGRLSQVVASEGIPFVRIGRQVMILNSDAAAFKRTKRAPGRPKKK